MIKESIPSEFFKTTNSFDRYHLGIFYRDFVLQKQYYPYQFDGWNDKKKYGILDNSGDVVYPKNSALKEYSTNFNNIHKNLFFVVDAFNELKKFQQNLSKTNKSLSNTIYSQLNVYGSTDDVPTLYLNYINKIYTIFQNSVMGDINIIKNINNIHSFIKYFTKFISIITKNIVINRSSFINSGLVPNSISGLRISVEQPSKIFDYRIAANIYIDNPEFTRFLDTASKFGFYVDKNVPWVLVADLESPTMKKYIEPYGIRTTDEIFDNFYFKAYTADLESLKNVVLSFWNGYSSIIADNEKTEIIKNCGSLFTEVNNLNQLNIETFEQYFNINWQLRLYCYTRILEERIKVTQNKFEIIHKESCLINKLYGTEKSLFYINSKINEFKSSDLQKRLDLTNPLDSSIVEPEKLLGSQLYNLNF